MSGLCDKHVFRATFSETQLSVQRFLQSRGLSLDDACDLLQDCFIKLWNNCKKVEPAKAKAFLFTAARNLSIDHYRKAKSQLKYQQQNRQDNEIKDGQYFLEMDEFKAQLEKAIDGMTPASKEVFLMNRFNNMTYKSIAQHLDISVKAVEKRMHKALKHLHSQKINLKR